MPKRFAVLSSLRYNFSVDNASGLKFDAGKLAWNHYLCSRLCTAVASVSALKDMLLFREAKDPCSVFFYFSLSVQWFVLA